MQITVVEIGSPVATGKYQTLEVIFKNEANEVKNKKLVSFSNPAVFKAVQGFAKGDVLEVETVKEGEYWQWKSISKVDGNKAITAPTPDKPAGKVLGSTYATAEERAQTQVYIVRQSSISAALNLLPLSKGKPTVENVLQIAKQFENFVFGIEAPTEVVNEEIF